MSQQDLTIILSIHTVLGLGYSFLIITRRSSLPSTFIPILLCIPFFGILSGLIADLVNKYKHRFNKIAPIEKIALEEDIYWKSIQKKSETRDIVPIEEALIINDRQTRKKMVLEMLLDDPLKNIDILLLARENNDIDTAHYANTTIAKIQRDLQLQVQQLAAQHGADPNDRKILNKYLETLGSFIKSGLSETYLLHRQRIIYGLLLNKKIELDGWSKDTLQEKFNNALALKDINEATNVNKTLLVNFPDDEITWINELQICVASHDSDRLKKTLDIIQSRDIEWSTAGSEKVSTWLEIN